MGETAETGPIAVWNGWTTPRWAPWDKLSSGGLGSSQRNCDDLLIWGLGKTHCDDILIWGLGITHPAA